MSLGNSCYKRKYRALKLAIDDIQSEIAEKMNDSHLADEQVQAFAYALDVIDKHIKVVEE